MSKSQTRQKLPPVWLIKVLGSFRTFLIRLNRNLFPGNVVLYEQFQYFWLLPALYVAAKLDIATLLKTKPLTSSEISEKIGADAPGILRIMRALASQGIFKETRNGRFALNGMSEALLEEQGSLRHMILHHLGPVNWNLMSNLEFTVMTGKDAFQNKYGKEIYTFLKDHPAEYAIFDKSMSNLSELGLSPILQAYDFSKFPVIADIGGGEGYLLANILQCNPAIQGTLFDTAEALKKAPQMLAHHEVENRVKIVAGDFFREIPPACNLYILKNIIHNWDDIQSAQILRNVGQAMTPGATVLIIEMVVPACSTPSLAKLLDIQMMATMSGGKERTASEFRSVIEDSGFKLRRIIPTIAPICLIEAEMIG
ncbi:MAG: methyltransferase [Bacteroidales bacterium]